MTSPRESLRALLANPEIKPQEFSITPIHGDDEVCMANIVGTENDKTVIIEVTVKKYIYDGLKIAT